MCTAESVECEILGEGVFPGFGGPFSYKEASTDLKLLSSQS